ncbi:MAG TPA: VOC family protein [Egibacteraceae bacterium]|nr:VOC family protein [Egibacteraceae bacterium]
MQSVTPMIAYEDVAAMVGWLEKAFGFKENLRYTEPDGGVSHAELDVGDGSIVMLGNPGPAYRSPAGHEQECEIARRTLDTPYIVDGVHVYVADVDAHFASAQAAGAAILSEIEDQGYGDRSYGVADPEGHRWMFAQRIHDVSPADWGAASAPAG